MPEDLLALARDLTERGEPFVLATVVRSESPTSAKPGSRAVIRTDGSITSWIGGSCAQPVIEREAPSCSSGVRSGGGSTPGSRWSRFSS